MRKLPSWWVRFPVRLLLLLVLLVGAGSLWWWSRADDPRFYLFLRSGPGHLLARVFGWYRDLGPDLVRDRPESRWAFDELALRYRWEKDLALETPLHRLHLTNGVVIEGRLLADYPAGITFQEPAGGGGLTQHFPRERILCVDTLPRPAYRVSYRDILFRKALPDFHFLKRPPFTVAFEGPEAEIQESLDALCGSFQDWTVRFADLVERPPVRTDLQVVFCSRDRVFTSFRERFAPETASAVGFYVQWIDRLFAMNFDSEDHRRLVDGRIQELERQNRQAGARPEWGDVEWGIWREHLRTRIRESDRAETLATIRHEGAHLFFHTTGVHSAFRAENEWLVEGLAAWCETPEPGDPQADYVRVVLAAQEKGRLPTVETLVDARRFTSLPGPENLAYAYAWTLVSWLMEPPRREGFFRYIRWQRDPAHVREVASQPAWGLLCREADLAPEAIAAGWAEHLEDLAIRTSNR